MGRHLDRRRAYGHVLHSAIVHHPDDGVGTIIDILRIVQYLTGRHQGRGGIGDLVDVSGVETVSPGPPRWSIVIGQRYAVRISAIDREE